MTLENKEYILTEEKKKLIDDAYSRFNFPGATKLLKLLNEKKVVVTKQEVESFLADQKEPRIHHNTLSIWDATDWYIHNDQFCEWLQTQPV